MSLLQNKYPLYVLDVLRGVDLFKEIILAVLNMTFP